MCPPTWDGGLSVPERSAPGSFWRQPWALNSGSLRCPGEGPRRQVRLGPRELQADLGVGVGGTCSNWSYGYYRAPWTRAIRGTSSSVGRWHHTSSKQSGGKAHWKQLVHAAQWWPVIPCAIGGPFYFATALEVMILFLTEFILKGLSFHFLRLTGK